MNTNYLKQTFFLFPEGEKIIKKLFKYSQDEDILEAKQEIRRELLIEANKSFIFLKHQEGLNHPFSPYVVNEYIQRVIINNLPITVLNYQNMIQYNDYLLKNTNPTFKQLKYGLTKLSIDISRRKEKEKHPFKKTTKKIQNYEQFLKMIQEFDGGKYISEEEVKVQVLARETRIFGGIFYESDKEEKQTKLIEIINERHEQTALEENFIKEMFKKYEERFNDFEELHKNLFDSFR